MTTDPIRAPWNAEQVRALNAFQQGGGMHPFTCGGDHTPGSPVLVAYTDGWRCPQPYGEACDYRQDWAHAFMADPRRAAVAVPVAAPPTTEQAAEGRCAVCRRPGDGSHPAVCFPPAPADRAATLREAADAVAALDRRKTGIVADTIKDAWEEGRDEGADLLRRLADEQTVSTAETAASLGMTPTAYRAASHRAAVEQIRDAARGLYADAGGRVLAALAAEAPHTETPDARLEQGRTQLLEAMSAVSEDRTCCGWAADWARTLHAEGGIWETLGRAVGWPTGNYDTWVWVSWDEAAALYAAPAVVAQPGKETQT